jgi:hypothetical protein
VSTSLKCFGVVFGREFIKFNTWLQINENLFCSLKIGFSAPRGIEQASNGRKLKILEKSYFLFKGMYMNAVESNQLLARPQLNQTI